MVTSFMLISVIIILQHKINQKSRKSKLSKRIDICYKFLLISDFYGAFIYVNFCYYYSSTTTFLLIIEMTS